MAPPTEPDAAAAGPEEEPRYGGFTRFEIELEVRALGNPPIACSATRSPPIRPHSPRTYNVPR